MPIEWNGKIAVRTWELVPKYFSSTQVLANRLVKDKDKPHGIRKIQSGGNGRELLIDFDTLEKEWRDELGDPRTIKSWMDHFYSEDEKLRMKFAMYRFQNGKGLDEKHVNEYSCNAFTLEAAWKLKDAREAQRQSLRGSLKGVMKTIWVDAMSYKELQRIKYGYSHTLPENERRFWDTMKRYKEEGFECLISKKYNNKNATKVLADEIEVLNGLFGGLRLKPSKSDVMKKYIRFVMGEIEVVRTDGDNAGEVISPEGFHWELSDSTIQKYLGAWQNRIGTHAKRSGNRQKYMNDYKPTHSMERPNWSGSILSVDDRNPPFLLPDGKRVWFYNAIDLHSEVWTCWVHGKSKEGIIIDFYRQLIRNYAEWGLGMPLELECESALNSTLRMGLLQDGALFERVRIEANNATGKKIERYFRELRYGVEKEMEGWQARPFARSEANQAKDEKKVTLTYKQITDQTIKAMQDWNNAPHPKYPDMSRWEVFLKYQNPDTKQINWRTVLKLIGKEGKRKCHTGLIELNEQEFVIGDLGQICLGEDLINKMKIVEGKRLDIRWLDDNHGKVLKAYAYIGDRYVCELIDKPVYNRAYFERTEQDHENYRLMSAYSNTIIAYGNKQKKAVPNLLILEKPKAKPELEETEVEVLEWPKQEEITYTPATKKSLFDRW